ncbi:MAG: hypothetical protein FWE88_03040 [Phycisphaerae bacterium]|nr:hypothetical protein [Phycisphaerae bacterium]
MTTPLAFTTFANAAFDIQPGQPLGLACVRYFRMAGDADVDAIVIHPVGTRYTPYRIALPRHVRLDVFRESSQEFVTILDRVLPAFDTENPQPHQLPLPGPESGRLFRLVCDDEYPVGPSHGEFWASQRVVPFDTLNKVDFLGTMRPAYEPPYQPPLTPAGVGKPAAPGMQARVEGAQVFYESPHFAIAFSLRRPMVTALGWDDRGLGNTASLTTKNTIWDFGSGSGSSRYHGDLLSGPSLRVVEDDYSAMAMGGQVRVEGNRVVYTDISGSRPGMKLDLCFTVNEKGVDIDITRHVDRTIVAADMDDFRFCWDICTTLTGVLGMPRFATGRCGLVSLPAMLNAPGRGTVLVSGTNARLKVDSWRNRNIAWAGILLDGATEDPHGLFTIPPGTYKANLSFAVTPLLPKLAPGKTERDIPAGMRRAFASAYTFRAEFGGYSNNNVSCNCHLSQYPPADMAHLADTPAGMPTTADLLRYTIQMALTGGPGYGDVRDLYIDADPSLLIASGRVYQLQRDKTWLGEMWPWILQVTRRVLANIDTESGLVCCRTLTGNSGTKLWSCMGWDVISSGHIDAYTNALAYRGLRNVQAMATAAGDAEMSATARAAADGIKASFQKVLVNPETGFVAGWRSQDGALHDHAFVAFTALPICFGLLDDAAAQRALTGLWNNMRDMGLDYFTYGLPVNLIPLPHSDIPPVQESRRQDSWDSFGIYVNGCLTPLWVTYFLYALRKYGMAAEAETIARGVDRGFERGLFTGGYRTGTEFFTWDGYPCGYEGALVGVMAAMGGILQTLGTCEMPPGGDWWPEEAD